MKLKNKLELECGITLKLQGVNPLLLEGIISDILSISDAKTMTDITAVGNLPGNDKMKVVELMGRMFRYCAGWGVKNSPNGDSVELMELLGKGSGKPHLQRAEWVLSITTDDERSELMALVPQLPEPSKKKKKRKKKKNKKGAGVTAVNSSSNGTVTHPDAEIVTNG